MQHQTKATASNLAEPSEGAYLASRTLERAACILGVDPGLSGALGFYFPAAPDRASAEDLPVAGNEIDAITLARRIAQMKPDLAVVERVSARPGQGVSSTFGFGTAYGAVRGVLGALRVPMHLVAPGLWKRHYRLGADKEQARALALRLFPATAECFQRRKDHGRAEAALIARYGAEVLLQGGRA
jgi:hypothetical protein